MSVRGVYSQPEEEMLAATNARMAAMEGWVEPAAREMTATKESIETMALAADRWNPLWSDDRYAAGTSWGGVVAHPLYIDRFGSGGIGAMDAPPECGFQHMIWIGEDWEFFVPVRAGDTFRILRRRPTLIDVTPLDGGGPRAFGLVESDKEYVNQNEELVAGSRLYVERTFLPEPPERYGMPEYAYSREELEYIASAVRQERVRGADVRWREDTEVGDSTPPAVLGPTSMADNAMSHVASPDFLMAMTSRDAFLRAVEGELTDELIPAATTGFYHVRGGPAGRHWSEYAARAEGEPHAFLFGVLSRLLMCRCITNWMGDDGFLTSYRWRHITRTPVGDTLIARGRVAAKRVENGMPLVDLVVWNENLRGFVSEAATATVRLRSREPLPDREQESRPHPQQALAAPSFQPGDRVRVESPGEQWPDPPGYRLANAEGTVVKWLEFDAVLDGFSDFVYVRIESAEGEGSAYVGDKLCFRREHLVRITP